MPTLSIDTLIIAKAALILVRVGGILFFLPIFGDSPTPVRIRVLISVGLSFIFFNLVPIDKNMDLNILPMSLIVVKEILVGFTLGFIARLTFDAVVMAASIVGYQMGFGMANLLVPDAGMQMNSFTALHRVIVMLIFFGLNLHHIFLDAIAKSFEVIPLGQVVASDGLANLFINVTASVFVIALQLSAPILVGLLFTMAALGLVARTVPQMNVFTLSFPISFFIGLAIYAASFPFYPEWLKESFMETHETMLLGLSGLTP